MTNRDYFSSDDYLLGLSFVGVLCSVVGFICGLTFWQNLNPNFEKFCSTTFQDSVSKYQDCKTSPWKYILKEVK